MMSEEDKEKMELLKQLFGNADIKAEQIVFGHGVYVHHAEHVDHHYYSSSETSQDASTEASADSPELSSQQRAEKECPWIGEILNSFYGEVELALEFVKMARSMKPIQITGLVNDWIKLKKISDLSCGRHLWKPLHEHGLYMPSEQNWNKQVRRP